MNGAENMIYFLQSPSDGNIKIGVSDNPYSRLRQLQTGSSSKGHFCILLAMPGGKKREKDLHILFEKYHIVREWFFPSEEIMNFITQETLEEIKECRICGGNYLTQPNKNDIVEHSSLHKLIRMGAYPYQVREFMKEVSWQILCSETPKIEIEAKRNADEIKRVIVYAWWSRKKQEGLLDADFEDYILDYMDFLDAKFSKNPRMRKEIELKLNRHWGDSRILLLDFF
jgi:hypothetical protein